MSTVLLRNINPLGTVDLPLVRRQEDSSGSTIGTEGVGGLEPGEVFEVDAELAGCPPYLEVVIDETTGDEVEVLRPGRGLLAQVGNYELASEPATPTPTDPVDAGADDTFAQEG